jgi:hypothetical protein
MAAQSVIQWMTFDFGFVPVRGLAVNHSGLAIHGVQATDVRGAKRWCDAADGLTKKPRNRGAFWCLRMQ